jgi:cytochrome c-type biogenesis protein CcmH/NrfF
MDATQSEIEESLTCQCGCGLTVHSCNHLQCPSAIPLKAEIASQLALGKTRPEVLAYFAGKYGEKILSAPTATGFNVIAWVMPFAAVLVAAAVMTVVARRWRRSVPTAAVAEPAGERDAAWRERLEAELKRFDA